MFCSTIIPTVGRPTLSRAVQSVLNQELRDDDFEIIVVNDSGRPLPHKPWMDSGRVQLIQTNRHNRSVARNTGAAIARGRYLHFLDDDDWMLPGAFCALHELTVQNSDQVGWFYGSFRLVDNDERTIVNIRPMEMGNSAIHLLASEWIPLQASLIDTRAFYKVGGFVPLQRLMGGYEDIHLSREIASQYELTSTDDVVTCIRFGDQGSTTFYENMINQNRQSRELILSLRDIFSRLRNSAANSSPSASYWHGRIVYYYLASASWNIRYRRPFSAASRATYAVAGLAAAGKKILTADFWHGLVGGPHTNLVARSTNKYTDLLFPNTRWLE